LSLPNIITEHVQTMLRIAKDRDEVLDVYEAAEGLKDGSTRRSN